LTRVDLPWNPPPTITVTPLRIAIPDNSLPLFNLIVFCSEIGDLNLIADNNGFSLTPDSRGNIESFDIKLTQF